MDKKIKVLVSVYVFFFLALLLTLFFWTSFSINSDVGPGEQELKCEEQGIELIGYSGNYPFKNAGDAANKIGVTYSGKQLSRPPNQTCLVNEDISGPKKSCEIGYPKNIMVVVNNESCAFISDSPQKNLITLILIHVALILIGGMIILYTYSIANKKDKEKIKQIITISVSFYFYLLIVLFMVSKFTYVY
jgi:hypothetical protein